MSSRKLSVIALACFPLVAAESQRPTIAPENVALVVNDEWERYRRILQISGDVPLHQWTIRGFGPKELSRLGPRDETHPWSPRATRAESMSRRFGAVTAGVLGARAQAIVNTGFPYGFNDAALWAGRGLTTAVEAGAWASVGPVTVIAAPTLFRAENGSFVLRDNGLSGAQRFGDAFEPSYIDQPQRYGNGAYVALDPGQSGIRVDLGGAALGFSTASQHWGPARDHPVILGNNAAGFPHVFVGTSRPIRAWILDGHARLFWGKLYSSRYTPMQSVEPDRFATGLAFNVSPRGMPGFELGAARFFHVLWSDDVLNETNLTQTFRGLLTGSSAESNPTGSQLDNQIASVFFRWVFPASGFELYGEYGREATYADTRDLALNPNNDVGFLLGFQRVWNASAEARRVFRAEVLNTRISALQVAHEQTRFYVHAPIGQGHTQRGQVLGSIGGFGGGAASLAYDDFGSRGRWTVAWSRIMRAERRAPVTDIPVVADADVMHALSFDALRFRGRTALTYEITAVQELNRNFGNDAFNLRTAAGIRYVW